MIRDILTNKWVLGGLGFLILFAGLCYLWYQYTTAPYREQAAELDEMIQQSERQRTASTAKRTEQAADAPVDSNTPTAEKPVTETTGAKTNTSTDETTKSVTAATQETDNTEELLISPHGFGPFPKVPSDYPGGYDPKFWEYPRTQNHELMTRVAIKLWEQGKQTHGTTMSNGLVYPTFPNTLIVTWKTQQTPFGTRRYASTISWCPEAEGFQRKMKRKLIYEGDFPSHFKIVERKDAGIDPYQFLDLPR